MECIEFESTGPPAEVLRPADREPPAPGPGEVRVRMIASPINPSDLMFIRGEYGQQPMLPQIPGFEGTGIVEDSGGGLRGSFFRGKRVVVLNRAGGNWANHAVVPSDQVIPISRTLSDEQAATFFVNPMTAWVMTREVLRVPRGAWLLQTAAGSSLGRMIIRLGRETGFRTLNVVRSRSQVDVLKKHGADEVVVYNPETDSEDEFRDQVMRAAGSSGLRCAIDAVGGVTGSAALRTLSTGGRMLSYGTLSGQPLQFSPRTLMTGGLSLEGFWLGPYMARQHLLFKLRMVRRITRLIQAGVLSTEIAQSFPLRNIHEAIESATTSPSAGRTLLTMSHSPESASQS